MKAIIIGDVHGRKFWKKPCEKVNDYDKVIFLGDYVDPYDFEGISVKDAIENFKEIIEFKKNNKDKVILLLGNHDMPYYSNEYFSFSRYHCRHSNKHHNEINELFEKNRTLFQIAYTYEDILFTHAGVESTWLDNAVECKEKDINKISDALNDLLKTPQGLTKLFMVSRARGGYDKYASCIWNDVSDMRWDIECKEDPDFIIKPIHNIKQIFGHTLRAFYDMNRNIAYGDAVEFDNCKMVDTTKPYILDTDTFKIEVYN